MMMNETLKTVNLNELEKLAKLLATENIVVEHRSVPTASFDTKNRVLTLPMWKDITPALYHMLVVHEISHALETDPVKWEETCKANPGIHATLNIVEDARIERLAKRRYPGTRRDFRDGYAELMERDFFKLNNDLNTYSFIDRLNIHYKIGHLVAVPFSDEELAFVNIIDGTDDMDGIIAVALRLFQRAKDKNENKPSEQEKQKGGAADGEADDSQPDTQNGDKESDEEDGVDGESDDDADANETDGPSEKSGDKPEQGDGETESAKTGNGAGKIDETKSETQQNLDDQLKTLNSTAPGKFSYVDLAKSYDYNKYIISYKDTVTDIIKRFPNIVSAMPLFTKMRTKNVSVVDYLCKEFEQRKAADQYIRAKEAKSGVINPNKLHSYKMVDDIFRKVTVNPDAKNHGIVIMVDFSGSMHSNMLGTIEQLLTIVMFCRKTGIAHRVYGFSDGWDYENIVPSATGRTTIIPDTNMRLVELFHEKMTTNDFRIMTEGLLMTYTGYYGYIRAFQLNSTPLNCALLLARNILADFKIKTRSQIVSLTLLTDGVSNPGYMMNPAGEGLQMFSTYGKSIIRDIKTGKTHSVQSNLTEKLVKIIREDGYEVTNFFITNKSGSRRVINSYVSYNTVKQSSEQLRKEFNSNGSIALPEYEGFSEYYMLSGGKDLQTADDEDFEFEVKENATTRQIAKAFTTARKDRMGSRVVLQRFAKKIAA
jgi:hypothetical protein